jgi:hypothetical protein
MSIDAQTHSGTRTSMPWDSRAVTRNAFITRTCGSLTRSVTRRHTFIPLRLTHRTLCMDDVVLGSDDDEYSQETQAWNVYASLLRANREQFLVANATRTATGEPLPKRAKVRRQCNTICHFLMHRYRPLTELHRAHNCPLLLRCLTNC